MLSVISKVTHNKEGALNGRKFLLLLTDTNQLILLQVF